MRKLLVIALIFVCSKGYSLNYYFSNSGDDSRSSVQAQNPNTPWASISKLNSFFTSLNAGDSVLFKRGDTFYGTITARKSGSASASIIFGAYGSGAKPIITGLTSVTSWTSLGGNLYESTSAVSTLSTLNMVTVSDAFQAIGRYPKKGTANDGWVTYQSHSGNTSITSNAISGYPSFIGGQVVIRKQHWIIDKYTVTNQTSTTVTYSGSGIYDPQDGYGFFFQNSSNACTAQGDWAYNTSTKKITMYSSGTPSGIKVATTDTLVYMSAKSYLTFDNINFTGSNGKLIWIDGASSNIVIKNCSLSFSGIDGIYVNSSSSSININNSTISYVLNNAIASDWYASSMSLSYNTISNAGMIAGMGQNGDGNAFAVTGIGTNSTVQYNELGNCGYLGIIFVGHDLTIQNNYIHDFCQIKDDGSAIYTADANTPGQYGQNRNILNNVIINGGNSTVDNGTSDGVASSYGIYTDQSASYVNIIGNTIANVYGGGMKTNSGTHLNITDNTVYNNIQGFNFNQNDVSHPLASVAMSRNIYFAKTTSQLVGMTFSNSNNLSAWGTWDSNYYCRPILEPNNIATNGCYTYGCTGGIIQFGDLSMGSIKDYSLLTTWQTLSSQDAHSKKTPKTITDTSQLRFAYNATNVPAITTLGAVYIDVYGNPYNGSITLQPYTSAVLIYSTAATLPLSASATNTSISCNGGTSTVTASASGGSTPYTYSIDGGSYQSSVTFNSIAAGTHTITAKDAVNTLANYGLNISQPTAISGYVETTTAPATVTTTASNGTGTLTYKLDGGSYQASNVFTGVGVGNHIVTVKDANNCTFPISFTVISAGVPLAISGSSIDPDCYGGNGSVTIGASGGTAPYTGTGVFAQAAGTVTYTVTDNVGAQKDTTITITNPPQVSIIQIITNNILVYGTTDTAFVSATGGTGTLTYQIDGGGYQASDTFPTVSAGNHTIDVKDANDCVNSQSFTMTSVPAPPPSSNYILRRKGRIHRYVNGN